MKAVLVVRVPNLRMATSQYSQSAGVASSAPSVPHAVTANVTAALTTVAPAATAAPLAFSHATHVPTTATFNATAPGWSPFHGHGAAVFRPPPTNGETHSGGHGHTAVHPGHRGGYVGYSGYAMAPAGVSAHGRPFVPVPAPPTVAQGLWGNVPHGRAQPPAAPPASQRAARGHSLSSHASMHAQPSYAPQAALVGAPAGYFGDALRAPYEQAKHSNFGAPHTAPPRGHQGSQGHGKTNRGRHRRGRRGQRGGRRGQGNGGDGGGGGGAAQPAAGQGPHLSSTPGAGPSNASGGGASGGGQGGKKHTLLVNYLGEMSSSQLRVRHPAAAGCRWWRAAGSSSPGLRHSPEPVLEVCYCPALPCGGRQCDRAHARLRVRSRGFRSGRPGADRQLEWLPPQYRRYLEAPQGLFPLPSLVLGLLLMLLLEQVAIASPRSKSRRGGNVYVRNLLPWVTGEHLQWVSARYGSVLDCKVLTGRCCAVAAPSSHASHPAVMFADAQGVSKGVGFVRFSFRREAEQAIAAMCNQRVVLRDDHTGGEMCLSNSLQLNMADQERPKTGDRGTRKSTNTDSTRAATPKSDGSRGSSYARGPSPSMASTPSSAGRGSHADFAPGAHAVQLSSPTAIAAHSHFAVGSTAVPALQPAPRAAQGVPTPQPSAAADAPAMRPRGYPAQVWASPFGNAFSASTPAVWSQPAAERLATPFTPTLLSPAEAGRAASVAAASPQAAAALSVGTSTAASSTQPVAAPVATWAASDMQGFFSGPSTLPAGAFAPPTMASGRNHGPVRGAGAASNLDGPSTPGFPGASAGGEPTAHGPPGF